MKFGFSEECLAHDTGRRHPESADRLLAIRRRLAREHGVEFVEADPATTDEVTAIHDPDYVESFREFCERGGGDWDPDTIAVEATWKAAHRSAGLAQWAAVEAIAGADGRDTPFSIGRPPGHHAVVDDAGGFCFFNNVAVAAQHVLDERDADRVAIVDWDVHHGNGTQDIFYDRDDVLFVSMHEEGMYPGTGAVEETGVDEGRGTTVNLPMPAGSTDADYAAVFDAGTAPAIRQFEPDLILVSAGFDAHRHDPISRMRLSTEGFGLLAARIRDLVDHAGAGLGFVLEGGYGLDTLADGIGMINDTFDGRKPVEPDDEVDDDVTALIECAREVHGIGSK